MNYPNNMSTSGQSARGESVLMTSNRWGEVARILVTSTMALLY